MKSGLKQLCVYPVLNLHFLLVQVGDEKEREREGEREKVTAEEKEETEQTSKAKKKHKASSQTKRVSCVDVRT